LILAQGQVLEKLSKSARSIPHEAGGLSWRSVRERFALRLT